MDLSMLKPFNFYLAKDKSKIVDHLGSPVTFVSGPDADDKAVIVGVSKCFHVVTAEYLRMAPIVWLEGKPVYKGDVLYLKESGGRRTVHAGELVDGSVNLLFMESGIRLHSSCLTWVENNTIGHEVSNLVCLLDSAGIPEGPLGWRVREYRREVEHERGLLLEELKNCVAVMERELKGLQVIQPELRGAQEAIAMVTK